MKSSVQHTIKIKFYSGIKCIYQSQQRKLHNLQKLRLASIRFTIVMGNQELHVIRKILKILIFLMILLYLMLSPQMLAKFSLIMKATNIMRKDRTSQIMIYLIQCMLVFQNIKPKGWMLIISKTRLGKERPLYDTKTFLMKCFWQLWNKPLHFM